MLTHASKSQLEGPLKFAVCRFGT